MKTNLPLRLTAPILALSVLLLSVGILAGWYVHRLDAVNSEVLESNFTSLRAAGEFDNGIQEIRHCLDSFRLSADPQYLQAIPGLRRQCDLALEDMHRYASIQVERDLMAQIEGGYRGFWHEFDQVSKSPPPSSLTLDVDHLSRDVHDYLNFNMTNFTRASVENQRVANLTVLSLLILGPCGAAGGLLAGYALARRFRRSIVQLSLPMRDAAGSLNVVEPPLTFSAGWGFQELESALREIADHVRTVVDELQQSQREVLRAEQLAGLGQLAAGLAHELRNPLSSMKILVQSATDQDGAGGLCGRELAVVEDEITRLDASIQMFLDFARPAQPEKNAFAVRTIIEQTVDLVAMRARSQGVEIHCRFPAEPVVLVADRGQLRQVLLNLLLNALDVLGNGGTVWVQVSTSDGARHDSCGVATATIQVADSGCGLPADLGTRIFEPFVSTKASGLGLGLSICQRIVEAHHGVITAANRPEGGSVFAVELPLAGQAESTLSDHYAQSSPGAA